MKRGIVLLALVGCQETGPARASPTPTPTATASASALGEFAWSTAARVFDLAGATDGAVVVWAAGAKLKAARFDSDGRLLAEVPVHSGFQGETPGAISVASTTRGLAVAWASRGRSAKIRVVTALPDLSTFDAPQQIGAAAGDSMLKAAAAKDRVAVFYSGEREPCDSDSQLSCTQFVMQNISSSDRHRRPHLSVPSVCERPLAGFAVHDGRYHYAVCSRVGGESATTLFSAQPHPAYAQAEHRLPSCTPLGLVSAGDQLWLVGRCGKRRAGVRIVGTEVAERVVDLSQVQLTCDASARPLLRTLGQPRIDLQLDRPMDGLAPILPDDIAPDGSHAVWTGRALLVARHRRGKLEVRRFRCQQGKMR